ncbi:MAG: hypothetical protein NVS3B21_15850 [Acidimicrobiales bacterium]
MQNAFVIGHIDIVAPWSRDMNRQVATRVRVATVTPAEINPLRPCVGRARRVGLGAGGHCQPRTVDHPAGVEPGPTRPMPIPDRTTPERQPVPARHEPADTGSDAFAHRLGADEADVLALPAVKTGTITHNGAK